MFSQSSSKASNLKIEQPRFKNSSIDMLNNNGNGNGFNNKGYMSTQNRNSKEVNFVKTQQRSISTEQSNVQSRNFVNQAELRFNPESVNEVNIKQNVKLEPLSIRTSQRQQRNRSFNDQTTPINPVINILNGINNTVKFGSIQERQDESTIRCPPNMPTFDDLLYHRNSSETQEANTSFLNSTILDAHPIFQTTDKAPFSSKQPPEDLNASFRVENRKARPKIVKNVNNICNIFIFQNNSVQQSNTTTQSRKHRKDPVAVPAQSPMAGKTSPTPSTSNNNNNNGLNIPMQQQFSSAQKPACYGSEEYDPAKDQYYFTFFKDCSNNAREENTTSNTDTGSVNHHINFDVTSMQNSNINSNNNLYNFTEVSKAKVPQSQQPEHSKTNLAEQPLKRKNNPQSPKKLLPQCFTGGEMSFEHRAAPKHARTASETPQLLQGTQNMIEELVGEAKHSVSINGNDKVVVRNNKLYVPQKVIHRLNERTNRDVSFEINKAQCV